MYTSSLNLLGKERQRVLECAFLEVAVVIVHLQFIWDSHIAFNPYNSFVFYYSGRALGNPHGYQLPCI